MQQARPVKCQGLRDHLPCGRELIGEQFCREHITFNLINLKTLKNVEHTITWIKKKKEQSENHLHSWFFTM